ncbi:MULTISPECIES: fimbrial protein [unclassified Serratia (in: enterobacteria)]|uniref:fimbrial protein n=1 Tax=unclassified Serratia (in: enterobacteria) TaxID=2647522 RepID=UPI0030763089
MDTQTMINNKPITKLAALLLGSLTLAAVAVSEAKAACAPVPDISITMPPLTFDGPADGPTIGQPIGSNWGAEISTPNYFSGCRVLRIITTPSLSNVVPGITYTENGVTYPIFSTSVPGIGIIIGLKPTNTSIYKPLRQPITEVFNGDSFGVGIDARAKLIVVGQLRAGVYNIAYGSLARINGSDGMGIGSSLLTLNPTTLTIRARTCQLSSASVQDVILPPVSKNQFSGVGTSPSVGQNFTVTTNCEAGVNLYATVTDANNPANTGNVLTLGENTTASGVGIQILRNNLPISFGPDSSAAGNLNQWYIGTANNTGNDAFTLPLRARYVQTDTNMVAGVVKARTTITFSYQ